MPLIVTTTTSGRPFRPTRGAEYVDGEVIDVTDSARTAPPSLPKHPDVA